MEHIEQPVIVTQTTSVLTVMLNRPTKKNAFTQAMYQQCADALSLIDEQSSIKVVVIKGAGDSFSAGNDLKDFLSHQHADNPFEHTLNFMRALVKCPVPVIAQVNGVAVGIGTTLLQHCDFVYAHKQSRFNMPFIQLGLCPEYAASQRMAEIVGVRKATEWLLLAQPFDAVEALDAGLLNAIFDDEQQLQEKVTTTVERLVSLPRDALVTSKRLMASVTTPEVIETEIVEFGRLLKQEAAQEAMASFVERRPINLARYQ